MHTVGSVMSQVDELIEMANAATGRSDTNLFDAVGALIEGYGQDNVCSHAEQETIYSPGESGYHTYEIRCKDCGDSLGSGVAPCEDANADGSCDMCGAAMPSDPVCSHDKVSASYQYNHDGTHTVTITCRACGEEVSDRTEECTAGTPQITSNGDGTHTVVTKCTECPGVLSETTENCMIAAKVTAKGDGTHGVVDRCLICGYVESTRTEDCVDGDGDGLCVICGAEIPTDLAVWTYSGANNELKGLTEKEFYVDKQDNDLTIQTDQSCVALGLTSSGTPLPVPVPKNSTKLTLTFSNTWTNHVSLLFFSGSSTNITDYAEYEADVVDKVVTVNASGSEYVAINCYGNVNYKTEQAKVAKGATLTFE